VGLFDRLRRTPGGDNVYVYENARPPEVSTGDADLIEAVVAHIETHVGEPDLVFHQLVSEYVHVDIHVVQPTEERPWVTLVTSGMSERPMTTPDDIGPQYSRAELTMSLPPDWPIQSKEERHYWPFRILQDIATLPHKYDSWLWLGHTIPNDDPPKPYADDTGFCCALLGVPALADPDFVQMTHGDHTVTFMAVYPLYEDETNLKLNEGAKALTERLKAAGVTDLLDPTRPSISD
jgi:hypothetical protein